MGWLRRVALFMHRDPIRGNTSGTDTRSNVPYGLFLIFFAFTFSLFIFVFAKEIMRWGSATPSVEINPKSWGILEGSLPKDCDSGTLVGIGCPAHPIQSALWASRNYRVPSGIKVPAPMARGDFWIGTKVSPEELSGAFNFRANQLILGWIKGSYRVWLDGHLVLEGSREDREPIVLALPMSRLISKESLHIAIHIQPEPQAAFPDVLAKPLKEGFASRSQASAYRSITSFWKKSRPFGLFLVNLVIASIFFLLWHSNQSKQEYFHLSTYGLVNAVFQVRLTDFFMSVFSPNINYSLDVILIFYEAAFGLFLGLAFARTRKAIFNWGIPIALVAPIVVALSLPDGSAKYDFNTFLYQWVLPASYFLGAMACVIQASYLKLSSGLRGRAINVRVFRLALFSLGLIALAAISVLQYHEFLSFVQRALLSRFAHLGLVLLLGGVALLEYREQQKMIEKTPVSPYHRRPILPESVSGVVMVVDLKNSERLFRTGALGGQSGQLVEACLSRLWAAVIKSEGMILQTEGDLLRAFFDSEVCKNPLLSALSASNQMKRELDILVQQMRAQGIVDQDFPEVEFRAGLSAGQIRPVWQEIENSRIASWIDTGETSPLLESARMLELEREVQSTQTSLVVMSEDMVVSSRNSLEAHLQHFKIRSHRCMGKHNRIYLVAGYVPVKELAQNTSAKVA